MAIRDNTFSDFYLLEQLAVTKDLNLFVHLHPIIKSYADLYFGKISNTNIKLLKLFGSTRSWPCNNPAWSMAYINFKNMNISYEDYMQEILLAILTMANRYKPQGPYPKFSIYVSKSFHYTLFESLKKISKSEMTYRSCLVSTSQLEYEKYLYELSEFEIIEEKVSHSYDCFSDNMFDFNWIVALGDSKFKNLSSIQRQIIVDYYLYKCTDKQISNKYGICRMSVNRIRQRIKDVLLRK